MKAVKNKFPHVNQRLCYDSTKYSTDRQGTESCGQGQKDWYLGSKVKSLEIKIENEHKMDTR
jgi:hypothetical protein